MLSINSNKGFDGIHTFKNIQKKDSIHSQPKQNEVVIMNGLNDDELENHIPESQTPISQNTLTQNLQILQSNTDDHLSIS